MLLVKTQKIIGCGAIAGYWGSTSESILPAIFVLPDYQEKGVGKRIIETPEQDEYFLRAKGIEIPSSITAVEFFKKMGYEYENGFAGIDEEQHTDWKSFSKFQSIALQRLTRHRV